MPLTDSKLRAVRPNGTRYELPDRQGLALRVGSTGIPLGAFSSNLYLKIG